jgi:hypothetical protein
MPVEHSIQHGGRCANVGKRLVRQPVFTTQVATHRPRQRARPNAMKALLYYRTAFE